MKLRSKIIASVASLTIAATIFLTGCGTPAANGEPLNETGILTLSVNPEIRIEYNKDGRVTALDGQNDDGKSIVKAYSDFVGKDCEEVLGDLIVKIHEAGYFIEDIDGNKKNIVLQLEPGSVLPDDDFLDNMSANTRSTVKGLKISSDVVTIDDDDYDPAYAKSGTPSRYITLEKAQEIALAQAKVKATEAVFEDKEFDHDDGTPVFELEFTANGKEYEYDIHAITGKVVKAKHKVIKEENKTKGDSNYGNSDYGPKNDGNSDYGNSNYSSKNSGDSNYGDSNYGSKKNNSSKQGDSNYASKNDGNSNYGDSNYNSNYSSKDKGNSNYGDSNYKDKGDSNYSSKNKGDSNYGDSNYNDDGDSDYDD